MTNYTNLKLEEREIMEHFKVFLNEVIEFYEDQLKAYIQHKDCEAFFEKAIDTDKRNLRKSYDLLDECIWFIQKNEPRANHLRLIIAIINSLNDIKRISKYTLAFSNFYFKEGEDRNDFIVGKIEQLGHLSVATMKSLYELIIEFELDKISERAKKIFENFILEYKEKYVNSINESIHLHNGNTRFIARTIIVVKNFDRSVDHVMNIIENMLTIL